MEFLIFVAFIVLFISLLAATSMPTESLKIRCAVHKWGLVDAEGDVPKDAPLDRRMHAVLMCKVCGKVPQRNGE